MYFLASTGKSGVRDGYRKPETGMLELLKEIFKSKQVDVENSFYCGDAAGRKADFSNDDLIFSINAGLKFLTPEMLFDGHLVNFPMVPGVKVDAKYMKEEKKTSEQNASDVETIKGFKKIAQSEVQELLIFVGGQGSGKSTFWRNYFSMHPNYKRINNDTIKNPAKALRFCKELLSDKKGKTSVIIDNCGTSAEVRSRYIKIAKECGTAQIRCLRFQTEKP